MGIKIHRNDGRFKVDGNKLTRGDVLLLDLLNDQDVGG